MTIEEFKAALIGEYAGEFEVRPSGHVRLRAFPGACPLSVMFGVNYIEKAERAGLPTARILRCADNYSVCNPDLRRWMEEVLVG